MTRAWRRIYLAAWLYAALLSVLVLYTLPALCGREVF